MSTDPGTLPPVPAQYGALDGGPPPPAVEPARRSRRRAKALDSTGPGSTEAARGALAPDTRTDEGPPTEPGADIPAPGPSGPPDPPRRPAAGPQGRQGYPTPAFPGGPAFPEPPGYLPGPDTSPGPYPDTERRGWRQRRQELREARAWQDLDGTEEVLQRRFRRDTVRVVRRIDTWTVLKVSLVFYLCVFVVVLISGVVLWNVAQAFNFTHDIEKSIKTLFGYNTFTLHPGPMFEYTVLGGIVLTVVGTLVNVLAALVYNLIADVVGGVQVIVVTEEL
jgi:hypothetical protein